MKVFPRRALLLLAMVLLAVIAPFALFGARMETWTADLLSQAAAHPRRTGAVLIALLAADILFPVPSSLISAACGMTLGFAAGVGASFLGMSLSAAAGYALGRLAAPTASRLIGPREQELLQAFHLRHGAWMLLALRPVPALAEASVLFSGIARQPLPSAAAAILAGNLAVSLAYAAVGAWGRATDSFLPAFGASLLFAGALLITARRRRVACRSLDAEEAR